LLAALAFLSIGVFTVIYLHYPRIALASWIAAIIAIPLSFILDAIFSLSRKIIGVRFRGNRYKGSFAAWCALIFGVADIFALLMVLAKWGMIAVGK